MEKGEAETNQIIVVRCIYFPHGKYFSEILTGDLMYFSWKLSAVIYCMCIHFNAVTTIHCMTGIV